MRAALPRIVCPSLVIQGADDAYGSTAQVTHIAEGASGPVETRLLPGCGHQPHLEQRAAVIAATTGFLAGALR